MKILFMGTPDFALSILSRLYDDGEDIVGVVTQPDRPKGRGYKLVPPVVKIFAEEKGIPVYQPEKLKDGAFEETLRELDPDMIVVAAYGKILPAYIINYPKYGCINAHASILPKYRGAAPIQRAIMEGERETGVTAMYMDEGLDTGDIILCERVTIEDEDDFETVHDKLALAGAEAISRVVALAKSGDIPRTKQNGDMSTYAAKIEREDRIIDFSKSAKRVRDKIRGLNPFPRALTYLPDGSALQITASSFANDAPGVPGEVVCSSNDGFTVKCGEGCILVTEVIPEGRGKMNAADFVHGRKTAPGDVLGEAQNG